MTFLREQLDKPIPSPVVLGQITEKFREAVKALAERQQIPIYQFDHKERKDGIARDLRDTPPKSILKFTNCCPSRRMTKVVRRNRRLCRILCWRRTKTGNWT